MDGAEVLRGVRRREGWDQRELAARSGVAPSTIAAVEAGRRAPSLLVLNAVLAAAGLELTVDLAPPSLEEAVVRHLHLSLAARLHLACGGDGRPDVPRRLPRWDTVQSLAARHTVHLHGQVALALWLPLGTQERVTVCARPTGAFAPAAGVPDPALLDVRTGCAGHGGPLVRVPLHRGQLTADPPAELALQPEHAAQRGVLRAVARLLHVQAPRDEAGRRARAHLDPDHVAERHEAFHTKGVAYPSRTDVRSWRLGDDVGLQAWLRRSGPGARDGPGLAG